MIGWPGAGLDLPTPAEIQVDKPPVTDLTRGDLSASTNRLADLVALEIVVLPVDPGGTDIEPGE